MCNLMLLNYKLPKNLFVTHTLPVRLTLPSPSRVCTFFRDVPAEGVCDRSGSQWDVRPLLVLPPGPGGAGRAGGRLL